MLGVSWPAWAGQPHCVSLINDVGVPTKEHLAPRAQPSLYPAWGHDVEPPRAIAVNGNRKLHIFSNRKLHTFVEGFHAKVTLLRCLLRYTGRFDRVAHGCKGRRAAVPAAACADASRVARGGRDWLPAGQPGRRRALLPTDQRPARARVDRADLQQGLRGMGKRAQRGGSWRRP